MTQGLDLAARIASIEAREAIKELTARYCWHVARADGEAVTRLYVEDCLFEIPGDGGRVLFKGREAIAKRLSQLRPASEVPMVTNHIIEIDGDDCVLTCTMRSAGMADGRPKPVLSGYYRDRCRRIDGDWMFVERRWYTYAPRFSVEDHMPSVEGEASGAVAGRNA